MLGVISRRVCPSWPGGRLLCCRWAFRAVVLFLKTVQRCELVQKQRVRPEQSTKRGCEVKTKDGGNRASEVRVNAEL